MNFFNQTRHSNWLKLSYQSNININITRPLSWVLYRVWYTQNQTVSCLRRGTAFSETRQHDRPIRTFNFWQWRSRCLFDLLELVSLIIYWFLFDHVPMLLDDVTEWFRVTGMVHGPFLFCCDWCLWNVYHKLGQLYHWVSVISTFTLWMLHIPQPLMYAP